jgi:hypothetical protein
MNKTDIYMEHKLIAYIIPTSQRVFFCLGLQLGDCTGTRPAMERQCQRQQIVVMLCRKESIFQEQWLMMIFLS